jgi:hypothetical protein
VIASPIRHEWGQHIQGVMARFAHAFQAVELTDCRDKMGRSRALCPPRLEEPPLDQVGQPLREPTLFRSPCKQPTAPRAQGREINASIGELQSSRIFPIKPPPHGFGGLAVVQVLSEWPDRHESQAPGGLGGWPDRGLQVSNLDIRINRAQCITHLHGPVPLGKGRGPPGRLVLAHR